MSRSQPPITIGRHGDTQGVVEEIREDALDAWNADTIDEVLRRAQRADPITSYDEFERCPSCLSYQIKQKDTTVSQNHQRPEPYKCTAENCRVHFEKPVPPRAAFDVDDPGCPECGSRRLAEADDVATAWTCLACAWSGDTAAEEPRESLVPMSADRADGFEWCTDELAEPGDRGAGPVLAGVDDETLAEIVVALYEPGEISYRDLAEIVPFSREWIGSRVRERRDGRSRRARAE